MHRHLYSLVLAAFLAASLASPARAADQANSAEAKLREAFRNTMLQLQTSETERATLQAAQTELEQKNKELEAKVEALNAKISSINKKSIEDKEASDKVVTGLNSQLGEQQKESARLGETLGKTKGDLVKAVELARNTDAKRAAAVSESIMLQRKVEDRETKNIALYKLGREILLRYEKFGLGTALVAREPFTGIARVKLETLVQDYQDKLTDQKIKSPPLAPEKAKAAPSKGKSSADKAGKASEQNASRS